MANINAKNIKFRLKVKLFLSNITERLKPPNFCYSSEKNGKNGKLDHIFALNHSPRILEMDFTCGCFFFFCMTELSDQFGVLGQVVSFDENY